MYPDLLNLGFLHLKTYGACMAIGFLICWHLLERLSGNRSVSGIVMPLIVSGVVGSRIAYVIEHWKAEFAAHPEMIIRVDKGGLMFYGGLILAIVVFVIWCRVHRENMLSMANLLATVIPLGHACGRIGCFFFGCCYGKLSQSALAISFPRHSPAWYEQLDAGLIKANAAWSLPVLPTQLIEAAALLFLFAILLAVYLKFRRHTLELYLVGYGVLRFFIEYLRGDPRAAVGPLSISQTISVAMIILGVAAFAFGCRERRVEK